MSSNVSFTGLVSGLNTAALVTNILRFNSARINTLQQIVTTDTKQQTAFTSVQSSLQKLQLDAAALGQSQGTAFDSKVATTSNSSALTAAAGTSAQTGVTSLTILSLAQASQIASQGYSDPNAAITQGSFQIQAGGDASTITIDSTNNTLSGLAQAINSAGVGVTATIVNTGSTDPRTQPYRLLLTSNSTGTANAIKITNNLGTSGGGAVQPNFASSVIGPAVTATNNFTGTATVASGGTYTGSANDTFSFSVVNGGTVGNDDGITVKYTNASGSQTGTLTINASDVNNPITVADGVQVTLGAGTLNASDQFSVNVFSPTIQAATNSQVQIGSGSGALVVQNSTNTVTNLIPGVTLSLQSANPNQTVQVNVANDSSTIATQITNFVNDYNSFMTNLNAQTAYTPGSGNTAGTAGPLNSNTQLIGIQTQLQQAMNAIIPNLPNVANRLGAIGISPNKDGTLTVDSAKLKSALSGGVSGVSVNDIKNLFSLQGQSSSAGIQFATGSAKTQSSTTPYTVHITQAAAQASVTASSTLAANTVIDSSNNTLDLSVNGSSVTVTIPSGTYSQQALATELQNQLNTELASKGSSVTVGSTNGQLSITSTIYGANSKINGLSGSALSTLGLTGSETSTGVDVAGSFIVNGVTETATGLGQVLTGDATNDHTSGLVVSVTLTSAQVAAGNTDASLTVTRGIASTLNSILQGLLDPVNGELTQMANQYTKTISDAQADVTNAQTAMSTQQSALMAQFASLETVLAKLQQTSSLMNVVFNSGSSSGSSSSSSTASSVLPNFSNSTTSG